MSRPEELIDSAQKFLGKEIIAAGIFGLQDDYRGIAALGAATAVLPETNSGVEAIEGVATVEGSRALNAQKQGVTVRMLVAVSVETIDLLSLPRFSGHQPGNLLMAFNRDKVKIKMKKFGLSRRINFKEGDQEIGLTGAVKGFSQEKDGDKAVLRALELI